jgi:hypothetical protein
LEDSGVVPIEEVPIFSKDFERPALPFIVILSKKATMLTDKGLEVAPFNNVRSVRWVTCIWPISVSISL